MRRFYPGLVWLPALILCGCNGGATPRTGTPLPAAQHGGHILSLPGGKGFAEILTERGAPAKGAATKAAKTRLLAYFYQPDGSTALSPAPSDVKVTLGAAETGRDVKLTPQTTPAGLFASEPGEFPDDLRGHIDLTLGGEPVKAEFMFR